MVSKFKYIEYYSYSNFNRPLHEILINNVVQQYNEPRYAIDADIKLKDDFIYCCNKERKNSK